MKYLKLLLICIVLCVSLTGCGSEDTTTDDTTNNGSDVSSDNESVTSESNNFTVSYDGVDITPGNLWEDNWTDEEYTYSEVTSCAFDGLDKVYTYKSFEITVSDINNQDVIYSVYFIDDDIETDKGIKVGDSVDDLIEVYGDSDNESNNEYIYSDEYVEVSFITQDNVIISIQYTYITG